jgi:hypothetical protein
MELKAFLAELVTSLARLDFVASLELRTEVFTVKGRVHLTQRGFLEVYFNERTQTVAVAWNEEERRRWGIDRDNLRGWHRHPVENPEDHQAIPAMSIYEIIKELGEVWRQEMSQFSIQNVLYAILICLRDAGSLGRGFTQPQGWKRQSPRKLLT